MAPISAQGNPAYAIDSQGFVVRGSQGECWRTSSWTPALANVVGCDGVLAKAVPVPSPAPSPRPAAPPAAPDTVPPSAAAPDAARTAPPVVVPPPAPPAEAGLGPDGGAATAARSDKITLDTDTYFDFDKSRLKPAGEEKLKAIAQRLAAMDLEVVVATGHTDWTGTGAYNQSLSERRAAAVKRYLVAQGLPEGRIFTEGKGEREPVASNQSREGRAKNRRVVVEVVGKRNR
jgi:OOP family OmpA-OmpF porin